MSARAGTDGDRRDRGRSTTTSSEQSHVGPVLAAGRIADAVIEAIRELNGEVLVQDRGAYLRVLVPQRCVLTREAVESHLGAPFRMPEDLESVLSSMKGRLELSESRAVWSFRPERKGGEI